MDGESAVGFFFVDKRFEIYNLDLIRNMEEITKLEEVIVLKYLTHCL